LVQCQLFGAVLHGLLHSACRLCAQAESC
jgi:hypothetical protein